MSGWQKTAARPEVWGYFDDSLGRVSRVRPSNHDAVRTHAVVLAASNAHERIKEDADLVCDGTSDDDDVSLALAMVKDAGGGIVQLSEGDFYFGAAPLVDFSKLKFRGAGQRASVIHLADNANSRVLRVASASAISGIAFEDFSIEGNKANQADGADPNARAGIFIDGLGGGSITDLAFRRLYVANTRGMGIACDGQTGAHVIRPRFEDVVALSCGDAAAAYDADGIHCGFCDDVDFRGVNASFNTDTGVALDHVGGAVHHGTVARGNLSNQLTAARASDNVKFLGCTADGFDVGAFGIRTGKFSEDTGLSTYVKILGCHLLNCVTTALHIEDHSVMLIKDTTWDGNGAVVAFVGTTAFIVNGGGNVGWAGATKGTATIANGQTSVTVNHNLGSGLTPALGNITVTPTNSMGNATKYRISNPTATQFTITVDQDPGATTATFVWQVRMDV